MTICAGSLQGFYFVTRLTVLYQPLLETGFFLNKHVVCASETRFYVSIMTEIFIFYNNQHNTTLGYDCILFWCQQM